jgi:CheY-like chemotaxis protein
MESSQRNEKHILLVEDSEDLRFLLQSFLESENYHVETAENGRVALAILGKLEKKPGLILLDMMMPVMDGFSFRQEQLKRPELAEIPVYVMTADQHGDDKSKRLGAAGFVTKPITDIEDFLHDIDRFFQKNHLPI